MTDAPPPQMPPPDMPPPTPPAKEPGFFLCGLMFFGGLVAVSAIAGAIAGLIGGANRSFSGGIVVLVAIGVAVYFSVRDDTFRRCFLKGLAVNAAVGVVLIGVCFAMVSSMYN